MIACLDEQVEIIANKTNTVGIASSLASSKDHTIGLKLFKTKSRLKGELTDSIYASPAAKYQTRHELTFSANFSLH